MKMNEKFKFTLVNTASSIEDSLRLTPWERMLENDRILNRLLKLEAFMENFNRGWNFIKSHHVNPR
jgi:hypothetical protein